MCKNEIVVSSFSVLLLLPLNRYTALWQCALASTWRIYSGKCVRVCACVRVYVWVLVCYSFFTHSSQSRVRTHNHNQSNRIELRGTHLFDIIIRLRRCCRLSLRPSLAPSIYTRILNRFIAVATDDWRWIDLSRFLLNDTRNLPLRSLIVRLFQCKRQSKWKKLHCCEIHSAFKGFSIALWSAAPASE